MSASPMIDIAFFEMMIHPAIAVHPDPKKILVITSNPMQAKTEISKYRFEIDVQTASALSALPQCEDNTFDIVILGEQEKLDLLTIAHINRVLTPKGIAVTVTGNFVETSNTMVEDLKTASPSFRIALPYRYESRTNQGFLFLSKLCHPLADINLQRVDLTDGFGYYNAEIHQAAFALPSYVRNMVAGVVKN